MSKKKIAIISIAGILLLSAIVFLLVANKKPSQKEQDKILKQQQDKELDKQLEISPEDSEKKDPPKIEEKQTKTNIKPQITMAEQNGEQIAVRAIVNGASKGNCILSIEKEGQQKIERTAILAVGPSYYMCQGFNIERSAFPVTGQWTVKVRLESDNAEGQSDPTAINIR